MRPCGSLNNAGLHCFLPRSCPDAIEILQLRPQFHLLCPAVGYAPWLQDLSSSRQAQGTGKVHHTSAEGKSTPPFTCHFGQVALPVHVGSEDCTFFSRFQRQAAVLCCADFKGLQPCTGPADACKVLLMLDIIASHPGKGCFQQVWLVPAQSTIS